VKWGALAIGELTDGGRLRATLARYRPAAVVHLAALAYVGESTLNPTLYHQNSVGRHRHSPISPSGSVSRH
jgi:UDP-arabinose 4-epimerase